MFNRLPEYVLDDDGQYHLIDVELADDDDDVDWIASVERLIGRFIMRFNDFESGLDSYIMDEMNERFEDGRVWVFLETLSTRQKIDALFKLFDVNFETLELAADSPLRVSGRALAQRLRDLNAKRNLYVHANWVDTSTDDDNLLVQHKTKRLASGAYGRIRRRITLAEMHSDIDSVLSLGDELDDWIQRSHCEIATRIDALRNTG